MLNEEYLEKYSENIAKDSDDAVQISKSAFKFKKEGNGIILTIHHTVKEKGKLLRIRLIFACFNDWCTQLLAIDNRGNFFIFNLSTKKYWKLAEIVPKACIARNVPNKPQEYVIGCRNGLIALLDVEKSRVLKYTQYSTERICNISFPGIKMKPFFAMIHCGTETILLNMKTFESSHRLDFNGSKIALKYAAYLPQSDSIFTCFTNDSIHIWSGMTLSTVRVINPIKKRNRDLKHGLTVFEVKFSTDNCDIDEEITRELNIKNYSNGLINSFAFSPDGTLVCLTTIDNFLIIMDSIKFEISRLIRLDTSLKDCAFLSKQDDILIVGLTVDGKLVLMDCQNNDAKIVIKSHGVSRFYLSLDGKLLCAISTTGEANVWLASKFINMLKTAKSCVDLIKGAYSNKKIVETDSALCFTDEIKCMLSYQRLIPILHEHGSYPDKYRNLIWAALLNLPYNRQQFYELIQMGMHPNIENMGKNIKLKNTTQKQYLLKILSCLAHWTKVFAFSDFLPHFIFPFVKTFPRNSLFTFEVIATILLNHCQLWFEFHPMEPLNYLGIIENVLNHFDPKLVKFYVTRNVSSKQYAWSVLMNGFAVILVEHQWCCLWDNIISSPPEFLPFCIVAYNILKRKEILRLPDSEAVAKYFNEQNSIILKQLISKANFLMKNCPDELNPRRYMNRFTELPKKVYPKFINYPQTFVEKQETEMAAMQMEQSILDQRIRQLEGEELNMAKRLECGLKDEEKTKRLKEMEKLYQDALKREEDRIAFQRKMLLLYEKEVRSQKGKVLELVKESIDRRNANLRESELDNLVNDAEKERIRNDIDMMFAEDSIRDLELEKLAEKYSESAMIDGVEMQPLAEKYKSELSKMYNERTRLKNDLNKFSLQKQSSTTECKMQDKIFQSQSRQRGSSEQEQTISTEKSGFNLDDIEGQLDAIQREFVSLVDR